MNIHNELYDQIYLTEVEIEGEMYHARYVGDELMVVVYESNGQPVPVWVCICDAEKFDYCVCGAWEHHMRKTEGGLFIWSPRTVQ